jgi:hypothetical protein
MILLASGCSNYIIQTESLVKQLKENQGFVKNDYFQQFTLVGYPSNNLFKIKCFDKQGNKLWLFPDKNTEFVIVRKSDGDKITVYFDTMILQNDTLYGLRSRLFGGLRKIAVSDVDKIEIYAEFPTTERIFSEE